jgi:low affinity Fe/Cu permease
MSASSIFRRFAAASSSAAGKPATFIGAAMLVVVWAATGPLFHFGDTWQLVINTSTTIITFLMVFLIQNTQNRDGAAVQIKLDELIRSSKAHNALLNLEELDDETLQRIRTHYCRLADKGRDELDDVERALADEGD